jgi:hypothetical protein
MVLSIIVLMGFLPLCLHDAFQEPLFLSRKQSLCGINFNRFRLYFFSH